MLYALVTHEKHKLAFISQNNFNIAIITFINEEYFNDKKYYLWKEKEKQIYRYIKKIFNDYHMRLN